MYIEKVQTYIKGIVRSSLSNTPSSVPPKLIINPKGTTLNQSKSFGFTLHGSWMFGRTPQGARSRTTTLNQSKSFGFTLIELLVVIAIISLLSSIVVASLSKARAKARDARRISDMRQIKTALEFYYDQYGCIPKTIGASSCLPPASTYIGNSLDFSDRADGKFMSFLKEAGFLPSIIKDPINNVNGGFGLDDYGYMYICYENEWSGADSKYLNGPLLVYYNEVGARTYNRALTEERTDTMNANPTNVMKCK